MSLYPEQSPPIPNPELIEPAKAFEESLEAIATGSIPEITAAAKRLLVLTLGYSSNTANEIIDLLTDQPRLPRPVEPGTRILKPAEPTSAQREQLVLRLTAFIVTTPEAAISGGTAVEWSHKAIEVAAAQRWDQCSHGNYNRCEKAVIEEYQAILRVYLDQALAAVSQATIPDEYETGLVVASLINDIHGAINELKEELSGNQEPVQPPH